MRLTPSALLVAAVLLLAGCGGKAEAPKRAAPPPALVTTTVAKAGGLEVTEDTLGTLEAVIDPRIGAEVAGRVVRVLAGSGQHVKKGQELVVIDDTDLTLQRRADDAEVARLQALLGQQERVVERQRQLAAKGFISQNAADDALALRNALKEQLAAARARAEAGRRNQGKARVVAPFDGFVETQLVAVGDYVKVGDPLMQLISNQRLRAHLPYPESAAARMKRGLPVRITTPQAPGRTFNGEVSEIRPGIAEGSRAIDVIVDLANDGSLRGGGTVNASVIVATKGNAVLVPEQSIVLRPAGKVVYAIIDGKAVQRIVQAGAKQGGMVEIVAGLKPGETIALDGAGFLTDGAVVQIRQAQAAAGSTPPSP